jgi:hypothetical protein
MAADLAWRQGKQIAVSVIYKYLHVSISLPGVCKTKELIVAARCGQW